MSGHPAASERVKKGTMFTNGRRGCENSCRIFLGVSTLESRRRGGLDIKATRENRTLFMEKIEIRKFESNAAGMSAGDKLSENSRRGFRLEGRASAL